MLGRIIISAREDRVTEEDHLVECDAGLLGKALKAIGLVYPFAGDVDRCRPADIDGKAWQQRLEQGLQFLALGVIGIPRVLGLERRLLTERGECDLAAAILDLLAPDVLVCIARLLDRLGQCFADALAFVAGEQIGIDTRPLAVGVTI